MTAQCYLRGQALCVRPKPTFGLPPAMVPESLWYVQKEAASALKETRMRMLHSKKTRKKERKLRVRP